MRRGLGVESAHRNQRAMRTLAPQEPKPPSRPGMREQFATCIVLFVAANAKCATVT